MKGDDWHGELLPSHRKAIDRWLHVRERKRMGFFRRIVIDYPWAVLAGGLLGVVTVFYAAVRYEWVEAALTWMAVKP